MNITKFTKAEIEFSSFLDNIDQPYSKKLITENKDLFEKAEVLLSYVLDRELRSIYFYKKGIYELYKANYIVARKLLFSAYYNLAKVNNDDSDLLNTRVLLAAGVTYQKQGLFLYALKVFKKALIFAEKINSIEYIAKLSNWKAICYSNLFIHDKALELNFTALEHFTYLNNKEWIANVNNSLGLDYSKLEQYKQAIKYFERAQKINLEIGYKVGEANVLNNLGLLYEKSGEYDKALHNYNRVVKLRIKFAGKMLLSRTYSNVASIYLNQKIFKKSIIAAKAGFEIASESSDYSSIHRCKLMLGYNYVNLEQYDKVEKIILELDDLSITLNINSFYLSNYTFCTYYYEQKRDLDNALKYQKLITETSNKICNDKLKSQNKLLKNIHEQAKRKQIKSIYQKKNLELSRTNANLTKSLHKLDVTNHILRHDLLNHLAVIKSAMRIIKVNKDYKYLEQITIRTNESIDLIRSLAKISSSANELDNPKIELDLNELIHEIMEANKSILFKIEGEAIIFANNEVKSVINNLVDNAIRHGKTKKIDFLLEQFSDKTKLSVIDYGKGIPHDISDKIFQKDFFHGDSGNTGLGLFIAKEVVEENFGELVYKPNQPNGAIFEIEFFKS